ncbi:hypothetical protein [Glycomyces sp. YM15]|uniref:hypothetical protein n=1 Tax=Glycomyces sp. YM15 TaxID=2800446 RepID=UPI0019629644|nr:hypothetical protein [Glycomyces sp. YM15]
MTTNRRHITVTQHVSNVDATSTVVGYVGAANDDTDVAVSQSAENIAAGATVIGAVFGDHQADTGRLTIPIAQDQ